jgi:hypothetical protein
MPRKRPTAEEKRTGPSRESDMTVFVNTCASIGAGRGSGAVSGLPSSPTAPVSISSPRKRSYRDVKRPVAIRRQIRRRR